ncbi:hypothetical protein TWF281_003092 [Arthrobotrys megalospora]
MIDVPEELKDEIVSYLSDNDLKNVRIASGEFRHAASRELFGKRNKGRLILGGGHDEERGFQSGDAYTLNNYALEILKRKPVEFCRLKSYLPSILPIAQYFTSLEYAPIFWDADLLSVRIGTHSGQEDGFCYSWPYTLKSWQDESGFQSDDEPRSCDEDNLDDDDEDQSEDEDQSDDEASYDDENEEPPDVDIWVDKPYVIPDRYTTNEERIHAASALEGFVKEQEANFEESLEALKQIILALSPQTVIIDGWYCYRLKGVIFHRGKLRETPTTRMRRYERHMWRNYQTLIPILHDANQQPQEIVIRCFPPYPFVGTNMPSKLLSSSIYVMGNLQRLRLCFTRGAEILSPMGVDMAPGSLYRLLDSCKESLKALRLDFDGGVGPLRGIKDLSSIVGKDESGLIVFSKLEELAINSLILPAVDLELLIKSQKNLRCLCLWSVCIYSPAFDWQQFFENIINPSKIERMHFYEVRSGPGNTTELENSQGPDFRDEIFSAALASNSRVYGWRFVPLDIYRPLMSASVTSLVREQSTFKTFNSKEHPVYVLKNNQQCVQDDEIYSY